MLLLVWGLTTLIHTAVMVITCLLLTQKYCHCLRIIFVVPPLILFILFFWSWILLSVLFIIFCFSFPACWFICYFLPLQMFHFAIVIALLDLHTNHSWEYIADLITFEMLTFLLPWNGDLSQSLLPSHTMLPVCNFPHIKLLTSTNPPSILFNLNPNTFSKVNIKSAVSALNSTSVSFGTASSNGRIVDAVTTNNGGTNVDELTKRAALAEEEAMYEKLKVCKIWMLYT